MSVPMMATTVVGRSLAFGCWSTKSSSEDCCWWKCSKCCGPFGRPAASIHAEEQPGWTNLMSPTAANGRYPHLPSIKRGWHFPRTLFLLFVNQKIFTKTAVLCNSPSWTNSEQNQTATSSARECLWHPQHLMSVSLTLQGFVEKCFLLFDVQVPSSA